MRHIDVTKFGRVIYTLPATTDVIADMQTYADLAARPARSATATPSSRP